MRRPRLHPGLRPVWRDATTLQLGTAPRHGVVLAGLRAGDDALVDALDGTHDLAGLRALARRRGLSAERADELVGALETAGALVGGPGQADRVHLGRLGPSARERLGGDAEGWSLSTPPPLDDGVAALARRTARRVVVDGLGRVGALLVETLLAAGVGGVEARDAAPVGPRDVGPGGHRPVDVGRPRADAVSGRSRAWTSSGSPAVQRPREPEPPDLVVLVRDDVVDVRVADELLRADQAHLAVVPGAERVTVGPLVVPGRGPCLRCLDLHRSDRDPAWPQVAAQLLAHQLRSPARGETALSVMAAGLAAVQVLAHLDGRAEPAARGRTLDVLLPDGTLERRRWGAHASCGCTRLPTDVRGDGRDDVRTGAAAQGRRP